MGVVVCRCGCGVGVGMDEGVTVGCDVYLLEPPSKEEPILCCVGSQHVFHVVLRSKKPDTDHTPHTTCIMYSNCIKWIVYLQPGGFAMSDSTIMAKINGDC